MILFALSLLYDLVDQDLRMSESNFRFSVCLWSSVNSAMASLAFDLQMEEKQAFLFKRFNAR